jgi:hypothetical protein
MNSEPTSLHYKPILYSVRAISLLLHYIRHCQQTDRELGTWEE